MRDEEFLKREYKLKGLPFKSKETVSKLDLESWVDREKELKKWKRMIKTALETPNINYLVFIIGDYGMGKTLSLQKILHDEEKNKKTFGIYVHFKSEEKVKKPGLDFLQKIFRGVDFDKIKIKKQDLRILEDVYNDPYIVFRKIFFSRDKYEKLLMQEFIRGTRSLSIKEMRQNGIIKKIEDMDTLREYFISFLHILYKSGYKTFIIGVDEFEYLFSLVSKSSQSIYLALLRRIKDLHLDVPNQLEDKIVNIVLFIATSEEGYRRLKELREVEKSTGGPIQPLFDRVDETTFLKPLNKLDTRKLIEKRLSLNRISRKYEKDPLIPFSEDFVEYIWKLTEGNPREIIKRCDYVLEEGLARKVKRLNKAFARAVFKEKGLVY